MEIINEKDLETVNGGYTGPVYYYTIQQGDCLSVIAQRFNTTVKDLQELNSITDANKIYAGKKLMVPYKG